MSASTPSSSSSFPPVVSGQCLNVPVLYETLKGEEEHCRVWLRDEMKQIPDPLIDSLFSRLIMLSSSSALPQSRLTVHELCGLLEGEKVELRMVLQDEMDRLVNTLFEILTNKLRANTNFYQSEDGGNRAQVVDPFDPVESPNSQSHQSAFLIPQPSKSTFGFDSHQQHSNGDEMKLNTVDIIEIKRRGDGEETRLIDIETLSEHNQAGGGDDGEKTRTETTQPMNCVEPEFKGEFDYEQEIEVKQEEDDDDDTTNNEVKLEIKEEFMEVEYEDEDDDDDDTANNEVKMEIKEEFLEEEEVDQTRIIDIDEMPEGNQTGDDESGSVVNAPKDTTQVHPNGQMNRLSGRVEKRKQTDEEPQAQNEVNNQEDIEEGLDNNDNDEEEVTSRSVKRPRPSRTSSTQITILTLRCLLLGCEEIIAKDDFNKHLLEKHSIGPFRCAVKDCVQTFNSNRTLGRHIKQNHHHTTQWPCGKCVKHFPSYTHLSNHTIQQHQLGQFQCSFPSCTFTGEYRDKVYSHHKQQHKPDFICPQSGCNYRNKNSTFFKAHERSHLGIKPFHCKWPDCHYSGASQKSAMAHVKQIHFKSSSTSDLTHLSKPKDYIELVR